MAALNTALHALFPGTFLVAISGGFFASLTLPNISRDQEAPFITCAREAGVGIGAAWDAVAPNFREEMRKEGLFVRLTFPPYEPNRIEWGISKLKEAAARFA